jgi:hypothetical protein
MGCPAFSNATAASLTVSISFAGEAKTMSQQIFCSAVLKTTPRPHQIIHTKNGDYLSLKKGHRVISRRLLYLFGTLFVWFMTLRWLLVPIDLVCLLMVLLGHF